MKLYECKLGDKVKIVGGLKHGCSGLKSEPGIVISKEDFYSKKEIKFWSGWIPEKHPKDIAFVEAEEEIYTVNNDCEVELLEKANTKRIRKTKEKVKDMKDFKIVDYKVYNNKALNVTFEDNLGNKVEEKAVCNEADKFDLERGIEVCVLKYVLGDTYKQIIREAGRQIKALDKEAKDKKAQEEMIARKKAKNARRKAARQEKARKERIAEMTEAYLAAMIEYDAALM
jgi:hypothetical protein